MPYVPIAEASRADRFAAAEKRWAAIVEVRPDLAPAVALQRTLLTTVAELLARLEERPLPRLSLPPRYLAAKLARGVPALAGEPIPVPAQLLTPAALRLCGELASGGAAESAGHLRETIASGSIDASSLFAASLARDQAAIRNGAVHRGLSPDLMWLVAELAVSPFAYLLQRGVLSSSAVADALESWAGGYCPACGSWPAIAEVLGGHRTLRCSLCAAGWELKTYACIYCANEGDTFITAAPDLERKDRRIEACGACGCYVKTVDVAGLSPFPLLAISDLETMDLDVAAMEHHYSRPPLKNFARRG